MFKHPSLPDFSQKIFKNLLYGTFVWNTQEQSSLLSSFKGFILDSTLFPQKKISFLEHSFPLWPLKTPSFPGHPHALFLSRSFFRKKNHLPLSSLSLPQASSLPSGHSLFFSSPSQSTSPKEPLSQDLSSEDFLCFQEKIQDTLPNFHYPLQDLSTFAYFHPKKRSFQLYVPTRTLEPLLFSLSPLLPYPLEIHPFFAPISPFLSFLLALYTLISTWHFSEPVCLSLEREEQVFFSSSVRLNTQLESFFHRRTLSLEKITLSFELFTHPFAPFSQELFERIAHSLLSHYCFPHFILQGILFYDPSLSAALELESAVQKSFLSLEGHLERAAQKINLPSMHLRNALMLCETKSKPQRSFFSYPFLSDYFIRVNTQLNALFEKMDYARKDSLFSLSKKTRAVAFGIGWDYPFFLSSPQQSSKKNSLILKLDKKNRLILFLSLLPSLRVLKKWRSFLGFYLSLPKKQIFFKSSSRFRRTSSLGDLMSAPETLFGKPLLKKAIRILLKKRFRSALPILFKVSLKPTPSLPSFHFPGICAIELEFKPSTLTHHFKKILFSFPFSSSSKLDQTSLFLLCHKAVLHVLQLIPSSSSIEFIFDSSCLDILQSSFSSSKGKQSHSLYSLAFLSFSISLQNALIKLHPPSLFTHLFSPHFFSSVTPLSLTPPSSRETVYEFSNPPSLALNSEAL